MSGGLTRTRTFLSGSYCFSVISDENEIAGYVESAFADLPISDQPSDELCLFRTNEPGWWVLRSESGSTPPLHLDAALAALVVLVNGKSVDAEPGCLHLHAALVGNGGRGVVMSAPSGTGKTTLAAELCRRGWQYATDETVSVAGVGAPLRGFLKPLVVKADGREIIDVSAMAVRADVESAHSWLVPAGRLGAVPVIELSPHVLVMLERDPEASAALPSSEQVHPADAAALLLTESLDADRFGPQASEVVAMVAADSACFRVRVAAPSATGDLIEALVLEAATKGRYEVHVPGPPRSRNIAPSVATTLVGGRAVLHKTDTGAVAALDVAGTDLWLHLLAAEVSDCEPTAAPFVAGLTEAGFLTPPTTSPR